MSNDPTRMKEQGDSLDQKIGELSPAKRALLEQMRAKLAGASNSIPRRADATRAPTSFSQDLLWQLDRSQPGLSAYHAGRALRLRGPLDPVALQKSLDALVSRHEVLRTTFDGSGSEPMQVVNAPAPVRIEELALVANNAREREDELSRLLGAFAQRPFDLANEPQFRVGLVSISHDDHILFWVSHHVALDGASFNVLVQEFARLYDGFTRHVPVTLPSQAITFGDFAAWQRTRLDGPYLETLLGYWRTRLAGAPEELPLPTDWPRPTRPGFVGGQRTVVLPLEQLEALREVARQQGTTLYALLVATYVTLLHRYSGIDDIVIGSPVAGRTRPETESLVGYFANTLVLRVDCTGDPTFSELLTRVRDTWLGAVEHQEIPLEKLVMELRKDRALGHAPLFQCTLTMEGASPIEARLASGELTVDLVELDSSLEGSAKFDLLLLVAERNDGLRLLLQYRADLFTGERAERILGHFRTLLESAVANPAQRLSQLPLATPAESTALAAWQQGPRMEPGNATVLSLFEAVADRAPQQAAVSANGKVLSFGELDARANQLAQHLRAAGVTKGAPVALCLPRSVDAIVGLLAILKAGGAYTPVAPELPAPRIAQQLHEGGIRFAVTDDAHRERFADAVVVAVDGDAEVIGQQSAQRGTSTVSPDDVAYILFTSGSTGVPKGVQVTHRNIVHYTRAVSRVLGDVAATSGGDGLAALAGWQFGLASTLAADLGNTSLYPSLLGGGTLHVLDDAVTTDPARFVEFMSTRGIDVLKITPNHLRALVGDRAGRELASVLPAKWIVLGGEALSLDFASRLLGAERCRVLNHYGPTEATVGCATFEVTGESLAEVRAAGAQSVPVGRPLAGEELVVHDRAGVALPVGIPGELLVGGAGVARGYVQRPDLTAERFVVEGNTRRYRTGDLVRWLPNGTIEFLGRADDQVKIRGYRVELGEVQHAIASHPGVAESAVILRQGDGDATLLAYVVPKASGYAAAHAERVTPDAVKAFAAERLPEYAVPAAVILLERLPLTANGKLDKAALPAPEQRAVDSFVAPRTDTETKLAQIWCEVLKKERVGVHDDFLKLGGHSLLAIRILGKISKVLGQRLPLRTLFDSPTVAQLAQYIEQARAAAGAASTDAKSTS